ncbi:hypothetical protein HYU07_02895 [Candidatus Woesearchaeota archaeon]|nr:hypothetical protein [Candidatus Woesearchaeota archaeon]
MVRSKQVYKKTFTRDFSLGMVELWCAGESTDPRQWAKEEQPFMPYIIFQRKNDAVVCYMNHNGIRWTKNKIRRMMNKDGAYTFFVAKNFLNIIKPIQYILKKESILDLKSLKKFTSRVRASWPWFGALWWAIDLLEEEGRTKELSPLLQARKEGELIGAGSDAVIRKSIKHAYPKLTSYVDVILLDEAISGRMPSQKKLEKRLKGYFYTNKTLFVSAKIEDIESKFKISIERPRKVRINKIRGQAAYKGIICGKARVIISRKQLSLMKRGEILIAPTTAPDFLTAMHKAAAFVADEGGIISHAAIVAREMKKPCIIGTKIATQVLKDGDLIEVNANEGLIKIIKRSKQKKNI